MNVNVLSLYTIMMVVMTVVMMAMMMMSEDLIICLVNSLVDPITEGVVTTWSEI